MQAQCIVFARYPDVLEPFKYAGYPLLLQAVTLPESPEPTTSHWTDAENNALLQVAKVMQTFWPVDLHHHLQSLADVFHACWL